MEKWIASVQEYEERKQSQSRGVGIVLVGGAMLRTVSFSLAPHSQISRGDTTCPRPIPHLQSAV
jgi:hypothetical protein